MKYLKSLITFMVALYCISFSIEIVKAETSSTENNEEVLKKQAEIDTYIFEDHYEEISEKGITVTHTAPLENSVEIGITPYNKDNEKYFIELFGADAVRIVEGQQAYTMNQSEESISQQVQEEDTSQNVSSSKTFIYLALAGIVVAFGFIYGIRKNKQVK